MPTDAAGAEAPMTDLAIDLEDRPGALAAMGAALGAALGAAPA